MNKTAVRMTRPDGLRSCKVRNVLILLSSLSFQLIWQSIFISTENHSQSRSLLRSPPIKTRAAGVASLKPSTVALSRGPTNTVG